MDSRHPAAEVDVDLELARDLLEEQQPSFSGRTLRRVDEGWDNVTYRIGSHHAMRLPRRLAAVQLLLNEQRWLPLVAPWVGVAVPLPVRRGMPSDLFPWPWSVVEWIEGRTADRTALAPGQGESLALVLRSLHRPAPSEAPSNPFRGVALSLRRAAVEERLERLRLNLPELVRMWRDALEAPTATAAAWLHGDLHPRNVVVRRGALAGLLDWGDMTAGDVATDLACAWTIFDARERAVFLEAYEPTEAERARAAGWAVNFGSALADSGEARHERMGRLIIQRLVSPDRDRP